MLTEKPGAEEAIAKLNRVHSTTSSEDQKYISQEPPYSMGFSFTQKSIIWDFLVAQVSVRGKSFANLQE